MVFISLHTDSQTIAAQKAAAIWAEMIEAWESKIDGQGEDAERRMDRARNLAAKRGFRFMSAMDVSSLPIDQILDRVERVVTPKGRIDRIEAEALLGGAQPPKITVSMALDRYWRLAKVKTLDKTADQIRRWQNPRKKAVANFIGCMGFDPVVEDITTRDLFQFRAWWVEKMADEGLTSNSANKDLIHLTGMIREVARSEEIAIKFDTRGLNLPNKNKATRPPFSDGWIRDRLLAPEAIAGLNDEARDILLIMVNTGARPSEIAALDASQIILDAEVPHIAISGAKRQLKTDNAKRKIPLLGVSLDAARRHPDGFPRYFDNPGLSDTINKFLRENGLLETSEHTLYGLRHSFEDRLLAAGVDNRIRADLMGHSLSRERYGAGATLKHLRDFLEPISF